LVSRASLHSSWDFTIFIAQGTKEQAKKSLTRTPQRYHLRAIGSIDAQTTPRYIDG
jgi:hypothetical protein